MWKKIDRLESAWKEWECTWLKEAKERDGYFKKTKQKKPLQTSTYTVVKEETPSEKKCSEDRINTNFHINPNIQWYF